MPDIIIRHTFFAGAPGNNKIQVGGDVIATDGNTATWDTMVDGDDLAATMNNKMRDAAIDALAALDPPVTVGALDKKTLIGGAIGL